MTLVTINKIEVHQSSSAKFVFEINSPAAGRNEDVYAIEFEGWVRSFNAYCKSITIRDVVSGASSTHPLYHAGMTRRTLASIRDLLRNKSSMRPMYHQHFNILANVVGFCPDFKLVMQGAMDDGSVIKLATISGTRKPVRSSFKPLLQPIILNSLGRTGTTMLMRLFSAHPNIVVQKPYPYEVHVASYWAQFFKVLSAPYPGPERDVPNIQQHHPAIMPNVNFISKYMSDPQVKYWVGVRYVEDLAGFCQQSMEGYYKSVAAAQNQKVPMYFAEKFYPSFIPWIIRDLYPKAKEIVLVRDFRDMLASINAFNAKRNSVKFGRNKVQSDEDYVRRLSVKGIHNLHQAWMARRDKVHLVRYEDVILDPINTLRSILQYLGLEHSNSTIETMLSAASTVENEAEQAHRTSRSPEESIGRWKKDLSPSLQALCEREFGSILKSFGY